MTRINEALAARMTRIRKGESDKGFTLIELLVVVIIIGILAAIAIPVFLNQREAAWRSSVESDVKNAALAVETFSVANNGSLSTLTGLDDTDFNASSNNEIELAVTGNTYEITGTSPDLDADYVYTSTDGSGAWSDAD